MDSCLEIKFSLLPLRCRRTWSHFAHLENIRICIFFQDLSLQHLFLSHYHPGPLILTSLGEYLCVPSALILLRCVLGRTSPGWAGLHVEEHFCWAELLTTRVWFGDAVPTPLAPLGCAHPGSLEPFWDLVIPFSGLGISFLDTEVSF